MGFLPVILMGVYRCKALPLANKAVPLLVRNGTALLAKAKGTTFDRTQNIYGKAYPQQNMVWCCGSSSTCS
jgi:hypothetical protein